MKKIKITALCLMAGCLFLGACTPASEKRESKQSTEAEQREQEEDKEQETGSSQTEEAPEESEEPVRPYTLSLITGSEYNPVWEEEQMLCYTDYQKIWLDTREDTSAVTGAEAFPELAEALKEMNAQAEESAGASIRELKENAREMKDMEYFPGLFWEEKLWVTRADSQMTSILKMGSSYAGGAHGYYVYTGVTFDSETGRQMKLEDVSGDSRRLAELAADRLAEKYPEVQFFEPPKDVLLKELEDNTLTWTLGYDGITFYFSPYELAPYADGSQTITILYKEEPDLFAREICQVPTAWAVRLSPGAEYDLNQDGTLDSIEAWASSEGMEDVYDSFMISVNGQECVQKDMWFYNYIPYLVYSDRLDTELLVTETVSDNDYVVFTVYNLDTESPEFGTPWQFLATGFSAYSEEKEDGTYEYGDEVFSNPDHFCLITRMELLSTYYGERWYGLCEEAKGEGYLKPEQPWYEVDRSDYPLTLLVPLEMEVGDTKETEEFPAGTKLWIVRTDGEYVEFVTEDDRRCRVYMEETEWPGRIRGAGDKDAMDIFDGMMFAG